MSDVKTHIATSTPQGITFRGRDLINDLVGRYSYTEILYFSITDTFPSHGQTRVLDACLVMLMEHGLTPSALIARLMVEAVPDQLQVAMGAGLMTIGSVFAGTIEECSQILVKGAMQTDPESHFRQLVADFRSRKQAVPGFGHRLHKPDDPRSPRLLQIAEEEGLAGKHVRLLRLLAAMVDASAGKHITLNATGAIAALLLDIGLPSRVARAIAVVSRSGGLVAHMLEEIDSGSARRIAALATENIPYADPPC